MKQEVMKMKFNLNDYKGKYAMHCKTKEEAESFCRFLDLHGRRWFDEGSYLKVDKWDTYKTDTAYYFNQGTYGSVEHIRRSENFVVLEWSDFMENKETVSEFTLNDLKPGDFVKLRDGQVCCVLFVYVDDSMTGGTVVLEDQHNNFKYRKFCSSDLIDVSDSDKDIMQVRRPTLSLDVSGNIFDNCNGDLLYAREEEMTLDEVCKALGRRIKIVEK